MINLTLFLSFFMITISFGKELTLDAIFKEDLFQRASLGHYQWIPEIDAYVVLEEDTVTNEKSLLSIDLVTGDTSLFISSEEFIIEEVTCLLLVIPTIPHIIFFFYNF